MRINLQIDHLILRGIPLTATDRAELTAALQLELERLLAYPGSNQPWAGLADQLHLQAPAVHYRPGNSPIRLGREIAASLYTSLQNHPSAPKSEQS